jgi:hypothetical protein
MLIKGIDPWSPWFRTNVLAIKPPNQFVKQYDTKWV